MTDVTLLARPTTVSIEEILETRAVRSVYQPIVDLDSRRIVAFEALARGPAARTSSRRTG